MVLKLTHVEVVTHPDVSNFTSKVSLPIKFKILTAKISIGYLENTERTTRCIAMFDLHDEFGTIELPLFVDCLLIASHSP